MDYEWPGNFAEVEVAIERSCTHSSGPVLQIADLATQLQQQRLQAQGVKAQPVSDCVLACGVVPIVELEKQAIVTTLRDLNGDKILTAKLIGIGKTTL